MSSCYKCGRELPDPMTECEYGCANRAITDAKERHRRDIVSQLERFKHAVAVDWDKVQTVDDMKAVFKCFFGDWKVLPGTDEYELLKRFLKEPKQGEQEAS